MKNNNIAKVTLSTMAFDFIMRFEGFKGKIYLCPAGKKTIGFGHVLQSDENYRIINQNQAKALLKKDLKIFENLVWRSVQISLSQHQFDALVSFAFNVGAAAFQRSTLRQIVNQNDWQEEDIIYEFSRWRHIRAVESAGLLRRRCAEADIFLYGWQ